MTSKRLNCGLNVVSRRIWKIWWHC